MNNSRWFRWALWATCLGVACGAILVALYPVFPNLIFRLMSLNRFAMLAASSTTSAVFPGDRIAYPGLRDVTFFNVVFVVVTGLQTGFLGAIVGLIWGRARTSRMPAS